MKTIESQPSLTHAWKRRFALTFDLVSYSNTAHINHVKVRVALIESHDKLTQRILVWPKAKTWKFRQEDFDVEINANGDRRIFNYTNVRGATPDLIVELSCSLFSATGSLAQEFGTKLTPVRKTRTQGFDQTGKAYNEFIAVYQSQYKPSWALQQIRFVAGTWGASEDLKAYSVFERLLP